MCKCSLQVTKPLIDGYGNPWNKEKDKIVHSPLQRSPLHFHCESGKVKKKEMGMGLNITVFIPSNINMAYGTPV